MRVLTIPPEPHANPANATMASQQPPAPSGQNARGVGRPGRRRRKLAALLSGTAVLLMMAMAARAEPWPERRRIYDERPPNEYLLIPAIASLPGTGVFLGIIGSASNLGDSGIDMGAALAKSIDNSDITVQALAFQNIPLFLKGFQLDYQVAHIKLGNLQIFLPGRNSPNFTIPVTAEFDVQFLMPNLQLFERRLQVYYGLGFFEGYDFDSQGNEAPFSRHSANGGFTLDFTDDLVDPRRGVRFGMRTSLHAPRRSLLGRNTRTSNLFGNEEDLRTRQYQLTVYIPFSERLHAAWNQQAFTTHGRENSEQIVPGGELPLRGYPGGRWSDRFGYFSGLELRYDHPMNRKLDIVVVRGVLEGLQYAAFYEVGQVNPLWNRSLVKDLHHSSGVGVRVLFQALVLRLDIARSDEGPQFHLTINHAF